MATGAKDTTATQRRIDPALLGWMRFFFYAAHFVVPLAAFALIAVYLAGYCECHHFDLSWPFLFVVGVALLPFLLPLVGAYIGKIGPVELKDGLPQERTIPRTVEAPAAPPVAAMAGAATVIDLGPNFDALTDDEKSVLKTLWVYQVQHTAGRGAGWWSFSVPTESPTYKNYLRGVGTLSERKLVGIDNGMVHLNDKGLAYCDLNDAGLAAVKSYWTVFRPA